MPQKEFKEQKFQTKLVTAVKLMLKDKGTISRSTTWTIVSIGHIVIECHQALMQMRLESMLKTIKYFY